MAYEGCYYSQSYPPGRCFARGTDENGKRVERDLAGVVHHPDYESVVDLTQGPHGVELSRHPDFDSALKAARKFACSISRQAWENREADAARDALILAAEQAKREKDRDEARRGVGEADLFAGHGGPWE